MVLLAAGALLCAGAARPAPAAGTPAGEVEVFEVSRLQPGMKGVGYTVLQGVEVQRFEAEVLGVLRSWAPQGEVVLCRLSSPQLEETGIVAGMSGSPVYIDGRLLGAVAYGFPYSTIPLAGITPAEEMLVACEIDRAQAETRDAAGSKARWREVLRRRHRAAYRSVREGRLCSGDAARRLISGTVSLIKDPSGGRSYAPRELPVPARKLLEGKGSVALAPLPLVLNVGGMDEGGFETLAPLMRMGGFMPVQAGAGGAEQGRAEVPLRPGVPVGAVLMSGDLNLAGMGTLTMVEGDRVVGFGHDMLGAGEVNLPMALGRAQATVPSLYNSFRITSAERIVGRLTQDRAPAVVGRLGEEAPMFPCTVRVRGDRDLEFNYRVAGYWRVAPMLGFYAVSQAALRWEGQGEMMTVRGRSRIRLKGREEPIVLENVYAGMSPLQPSAELVLQPLNAVVLNPFKEIELDSLEVEIEIEDGLRAADIRAVRLQSREVRPGGSLTLWVDLKEFQGPTHTRQIELRVPEDARPDTTAEILVCDSTVSYMRRVGHDPGFFQPRDFDALLETVQTLPSHRRLHARASFVRRGLRYRGEAMPALPSSAINMLRMGTESGSATDLVRDVETSIKTPWVLSGAVSVQVAVRPPQGEASRSY